MAGDVVIHGDDDAHALSQRHTVKISSLDLPPDSFFASAPSNAFLGSRTMVSFGGVGGLKRSGSSFYGSNEQEEISDEYLEEYLNQQEKKRRLSVEQVQFLERNFETENKLEPDRKIQLAKDLGLKPRQIAIWFQNRRARWKTKQLETDYETLHGSYESLKADYGNILKENEKLKAEVLHLKHNGISEKMKTNFEFCDSEEQLCGVMRNQATGHMIGETEEHEMSAVAFKNGERNSAKSDVTDAVSPCLTDGVHSFFLESGESSHVFELNHSDLSRNTEENLDDEFPAMDEAYILLPSSSCNHGFPVEDHTFGFWSY